MSDENFTDDAELDMFGMPVLPIRERRGRPSFGKSRENQELVSLLRAAGWSQKRIAGYLQCDEKTLRKNFSRELQDGADLIEGMALEVTLKKMRTGNSVATGRIFDIIDKGRIEPPPPPKTDSDEKTAPLGKKAQADLDAKDAHTKTGWGNLLQ